MAPLKAVLKVASLDMSRVDQLEPLKVEQWAAWMVVMLVDKMAPSLVEMLAV